MMQVRIIANKLARDTQKGHRETQNNHTEVQNDHKQTQNDYKKIYLFLNYKDLSHDDTANKFASNNNRFQTSTHGVKRSLI